MKLHRSIPPILAVGVVLVHVRSQLSLAFQQVHRGYLHSHSIGRPTVVSLSNGRFDREFDEKACMRAAEKAAGKGAGEAAAGAILGGLVFGPFGALFGAQIGASMGSQRAFDSEREKEMEKMGISKDMLRMAEDVGVALERAIDGLKVTRGSLETQQSFARRLDAQQERLYEQAKAALEDGEEERARDLLIQRKDIEEKLKKALVGCAEERKRLDQMESNVLALEERAMEVERILKRSVGATALQGSSMDKFALESADPLLQKFKDMGID
mmetsp:Transcript_18003/g.39359  ORF Transcript_18003/g.39359 Transcript_18003/m.39359 type:complete len:270 (+) Transcript_18003:281-1090(+)|eukprot:CAMPEP_0178483302 /NCGR_PEP_ID=MMETSP0696-20121128/7164_1 /TAXON_ID=265572 /ORGANISM="Extubocellulus spinifer, Strain CCMP396" /LENGTH=269 /DNA_ID=CAMNT_0020110815 /DNA_START=268 /DNA_END=1077 /DNA_ORIENTATION=+